MRPACWTTCPSSCASSRNPPGLRGRYAPCAKTTFVPIVKARACRNRAASPARSSACTRTAEKLTPNPFSMVVRVAASSGTPPGVSSRASPACLPCTARGRRGATGGELFSDVLAGPAGCGSMPSGPRCDSACTARRLKWWRGIGLGRAGRGSSRAAETFGRAPAPEPPAGPGRSARTYCPAMANLPRRC